MKIILDTNFLITALKFKIDIIKELKKYSNNIYIIDKTINELNNINNIYARMALKLTKDIPIIKTREGKTDDILVDLSKKGYIIATQDKELKKRLNNYIIIRQKKYLKLINQNIY